MNIFILLLFFQSQMSSQSSLVNAKGTLVLDLSDLLYEPKKHAPRIQENIATRCSQDKLLTVFYETVLELSFYTKLEHIVKQFTEIQTDKECQLRLLISLKYTINQPNEYSLIAEFVKNRTLIIAGVSIEKGKNNRTELLVENQSMFDVQKLKTEVELNRLKNSPGKVNVGYAFNYTYCPDCIVHNPHIQEADYLIVKVLFRPNDKRFVESYGIFKENIDTIYNSTQTWFNSKNRTIAKTVYYKIDIQFTNDTDPCIEKRYEQLLNEYLKEWESHNFTNTNVIINGSSDCLKKSNGCIMTCMETTDNLIPYLTYLPSFNEKIRNINGRFRMVQPASILLENVASSGFDTFMINTATALQLNKSVFSSSDRCRPKYFIYFLETPSSELNVLKKSSFGNITMKSMYFYYKNDKEFKALEKWVKDNKESHHNITTACYARDTTLASLSPSQNCDKECAFSIGNVNKCRYIQSNITGIVWKISVNFENDTIENFADNIMKRLDGLVMGRHMLRTKAPKLQITLQITIEFTGFLKSEIESPVTLFCSKIGARIRQFYEAILAWAKIHEFPVVIEPSKGIYNFGNPLVWEQLAVREPADIRQAMESYPIFVRRSYNHSRVFGAWTKGMYPCIPASKELQSNENISFDLEHVGISFNINSKKNNQNLSVALLQAFLQFQIVEINFKSAVLTNFTKDKVFENFLNTSRDINRTLLLQIPLSPRITTFGPSLNETVSFFKEVGMHVIMFSPQILDDRLSQFANTSKSVGMGIKLSNCSNLIYKLVFTGNDTNEEVQNAEYLICENVRFFGNPNNLTSIQDFLNLHLYIDKVIRYNYADIKRVYFRISLAENCAENYTLTRTIFLHHINNYAKAYKIHYILPITLIQKGCSDNMTLSQSNTEVTDPTAIVQIDELNKIETSTNSIQTTTANPHTASGNQTLPPNITNNKTAKSEDILRKSTTTDQNITQNSTNKSVLQYQSFDFFGHMPYFAGGAGLLICILLGLVGIRFKQIKSRLTQKEVLEFYNGQMDLIRQAIHARRHNTIYIGNFYDGLVYQRSFELLKPVVTLALKNGQFLGKNKYSTTYRCRVDRLQADVALKVIKKGCPTEIFKGYLSEIKLLCYIGDHNNLVKFLGCHTKEIQNCTVWIAMEFCDGGSLLTYLQNKTVGEYDTDFQELVKFCRDIACGMQYIADQDVIHGDLSARQVMLDHKLTCKIKGLGLMRKITVYQTYVKKSQWDKIPWQWIAPESLRKFVFSSKSDVWSFGITLWEIFSLGETPYPEITWKPGFIHDVEKGMRMESPPLATNAIFDVVKECWDIMPDKRPDFLKLFEFFGNLMSSETSSPSSASYETFL